jgi:hypothetical protein
MPMRPTLRKLSFFFEKTFSFFFGAKPFSAILQLWGRPTEAAFDTPF